MREHRTRAAREREVLPRFRRRTLRRFPYTLYYLVAGEQVILSLIFHGSRDPRELYARLEDDGP